MAGDRTTWDHATDKDLLGAIVDEIAPKQEQLRGVVDRMHALGHTCTLKALKQHLQKLRRKETGTGATSDGPSTPSTPKTPTARKRAPKKAPSTGKGRKRAAADDDDEDTPASKKMKKYSDEEDSKQRISDNDAI